jgi:hypothetical protein
MVYVSVGQKNDIQGQGVEVKGLSVSLFLVSALMKSTVDENPTFGDLQHIAGPCNLFGSSQDFQPHKNTSSKGYIDSI